MKWKWLAPGAALFMAGALADDSTGRANISGEWRQEAGAESWILQSKEDAIHVAQLRNGQKVTEFDCNTLGQECEVKDAGRHAKVTFYFNGAKLVQLETRGSKVVKRRFSVDDQGDSMEVEEIPVVPEGKTVIEQFKRVQASAAQK
jgi:hypothetical protein